jgi:hypothetical protein
MVLYLVLTQHSELLSTYLVIMLVLGTYTALSELLSTY